MILLLRVLGVHAHPDQESTLNVLICHHMKGDKGCHQPPHYYTWLGWDRLKYDLLNKGLVQKLV
jgi:hypothetical protein